VEVKRWTVALSKLAKQASLVMSMNMPHFPQLGSQLSPTLTDIEALILSHYFEAE
jgi:hypothetical protein